MPGGSLTVEVHLHVLGKDVDVGILLVGGIAVLVNSDGITEQFDCISKTMIGIDAVDWERFQMMGDKCMIRHHQCVFTIVQDAKLLQSEYSHSRVGVEVAAETVRLEGQCTASVFFLGKTEDVGSKSNLRLALLLAVAKVVVSEDSNHDA